MASPSEADRLAREKAESDKKAAEDAAAATAAAATANWPIGGYVSLLFMFALAVLVIRVDVSAICVVLASILRDQYVMYPVNAMLVIISWINLLGKLPIYSTPQSSRRTVGCLRSGRGRRRRQTSRASTR